MTPDEVKSFLHLKSCRKRLAEMQADPDDRSHGKWTGYKYGCRCDRCMEAMREYTRAHYAKNRERINERHRAYHRRRYLEDPDTVRAEWRESKRRQAARKRERDGRA